MNKIPILAIIIPLLFLIYGGYVIYLSDTPTTYQTDREHKPNIDSQPTLTPVSSNQTHPSLNNSQENYDFIGRITEKLYSNQNGGTTTEQYKVVTKANIPGIEKGYIIVNYQITPSTTYKIVEPNKFYRIKAIYDSERTQYEAVLVVYFPGVQEI